jgi:hypothetical protein
MYFTETSDGNSEPKIKLVMGLKQKGVLKSTEESRLYTFTLSTANKEEVELRLESENGHFSVLVGQGFVPTEKNYTHQGTERYPLLFQPSEGTEDKLTYYVRVQPMQFDLKKPNQSADSAGMAYQYTLAFFEEGSLYHLVEGIASAGIVQSDTFDYYYLDIP